MSTHKKININMVEVNKNIFPDEIHLKDLGIHKGTRKFELLQDFKCNYYDGNVVTVQKGFITDGVSVPKFAWGIIGPFGSAFPAALIHDWLFSPFNKKYNWRESNWMFLKLMKDCGVNFVERQVIYAAVVAGSYPIWKKRFENYGIK
jgi:hypothetical protein